MVLALVGDSTITKFFAIVSIFHFWVGVYSLFFACKISGIKAYERNFFTKKILFY